MPCTLVKEDLRTHGIIWAVPHGGILANRQVPKISQCPILILGSESDVPCHAGAYPNKMFIGPCISPLSFVRWNRILA